MARSSAAIAINASTRTSRPRAGRSTSSRRFPYEEMLAKLGKKESRAQRMAFYLDWAARFNPRQFEPYNIVAQRIYDLKSLPRRESKDSKNVQTTIAAARRILLEKYGRQAQTEAGGVRASVDDYDAARMLKKTNARLRSSKDALLRHAAIINPKNIRDERWRNYVHQSIGSIVKMIGSEDFNNKLLPPSDD